jgi:RimJ/RimL family protein N-acetyltransferase
LETERLLLRSFRAEDFDAHHAILTHPEVQRYLGPPHSREDLWRRTVGSVGMWSVVGFGGWVVIDKATGRLIGNAGFFDAKRDLKPDFGGAPEMGWIFDPQVHGLGVAREACSAALKWADENLQPTPIWAIVDPANERSLRFGARLGFERLADRVYNGEPIAILKRPANRA